MLRRMRKLFRSESGQGMSEYLIIVALIAVAASAWSPSSARTSGSCSPGRRTRSRAVGQAQRRRRPDEEQDAQGLRNELEDGRLEGRWRDASSGRCAAGDAGAQGSVSRQRQRSGCMLNQGAMGRDRDRTVRSDEHNSRGIELADRGWLDEAIKRVQEGHRARSRVGARPRQPRHRLLGEEALSRGARGVPDRSPARARQRRRPTTTSPASSPPTGRTWRSRSTRKPSSSTRTTRTPTSTWE